MTHQQEPENQANLEKPAKHVDRSIKTSRLKDKEFENYMKIHQQLNRFTPKSVNLS